MGPAPAVHAGDLAYLAFTSGSTGEPKAVLGEHGPLSHFLDWYRQHFDLDASERISCLSGIGHDPLLRDLFTPLTLGGTLCMPDPDTFAEPARLAGWLAEQAVTTIHLTPALAQLLAGAAPTGRLPALRRAVFGGDVLTGRDLQALQRLAPRSAAVNVYGATETPQVMAYSELAPGAAANLDAQQSVPLGQGIDGAQLLVLTAAGQPAGVGELGEIAIRTPYLTRGYLGDPALTRERFLADPFGAGPQVRLYKTGDLGRYRPDGQVEFAGRADRQVKVRGFRVEPAEVEALLLEHPAVREAAVVPVPTASGDHRLAAYVVARPGHEVDPTDLRRHLAAHLPTFMVPAAILPLTELPRTASGKLDRRALPSPTTRSIEGLAPHYVPPRDGVESVLVEIWQQLLERQPIGIHDNFFDLGGHSLLAGRVATAVRDRLAIELPLRSLFEHPTIAGLAVHLAQQRAGSQNRDELDDLLAEIEGLSEEEVAGMLEEA